MAYKLSNIFQFHYFRVNPKNWSPFGLKTSRASRCNVLVLSLVLKSISHFKGTVSIFDCLELPLLAKKDVFPYYLLGSLEISPMGRTARLVRQAKNSNADFASLTVNFEASTPFAAFSKIVNLSLLSGQSLVVFRKVPILPQLGSRQANLLDN